MPLSWGKIWRSRFTVLLVAFFLSPSILNAQDEFNRFSSFVRPTFETHCFQCHSNENSVEGDADLGGLGSDNLAQNLDLLNEVIHALETEAMPPSDGPELSADSRRQLIVDLKDILETVVQRQNLYPRTPVRRMNRFQYNNAVVDLFGLNCIVFILPERMLREHGNYFQPASNKMPERVRVGSRPLGKSQMIEPRLAGVAAFPQDLRAENGFDNQADHLSLSPLLMESFLKLGQSITESPDFGPKSAGLWKTFFETPQGLSAKSPDTEIETAIRTRVRPFLSRAFRGHVSRETVDRYVAYGVAKFLKDESFEATMKSIAAATIASPRFLYLYDQDEFPTEAATTQVSGHELASRLSFFLWGSLPDKELLDLAETGALTEENVLGEQVDRMLNDRKLKRFCDSFPSQWLQLERIISSSPNREQFDDFYFGKYRKSMHMMLEPLLLFETVLIENKPITTLIDSDFTYRSVLLERAYKSLGNSTKNKKGGGGVQVLNFFRVPVKDRRTGGLITNAAVMTMTSGPERTQPITRGAWIAGVVFNDPPEPPPADVPELGDKPRVGEEDLTLRERLALHRERSDCRGCHEQIDPLGFALENYDPVGAWRDTYSNQRVVDVSGELFRQHRFKTVIEFKDAILKEKDRFARGLAGHLLKFALARELGPADRIALDKVVEETKQDGYRIKTLIKAVVLSDSFRSKSRKLPARVASEQTIDSTTGN